jgi:uncharacterized protein (TIGR03435 family)
MRKNVTLLVAGMAALAALTRVPVRAQSDAKPLSFDVASVKPNRSGGNSVTPPGHDMYLAENFSLGMLIRNAYQLSSASEMSGGPSWIESERFDVKAKYNDGASAEQRQTMLRTLLAERFALKVHIEQRELRGYTLLVARSDGRLGPRLVPSTRDCAAEPPITRQALIEAQDTFVPPCGMGLTGPHYFAATAKTISSLAVLLSRLGDVNRPVVDETGLSGNFDFDLTWTPIPNQIPVQPLGAPGPDAYGPTIFTALEEQLGLALKAADGPWDVLVIDHIERPTED